jgi:hypothetical protein
MVVVDARKSASRSMVALRARLSTCCKAITQRQAAAPAVCHFATVAVSLVKRERPYLSVDDLSRRVMGQCPKDVQGKVTPEVMDAVMR